MFRADMKLRCCIPELQYVAYFFLFLTNHQFISKVFLHQEKNNSTKFYFFICERIFIKTNSLNYAHHVTRSSGKIFLLVGTPCF